MCGFSIKTKTGNEIEVKALKILIFSLLQVLFKNQAMFRTEDSGTGIVYIYPLHYTLRTYIYIKTFCDDGGLNEISLTQHTGDV